MALSFDEKAQQAFSADVRMISGCLDSKTSADVSNIRHFDLPNSKGRIGGACTEALLEVLYAEKGDPYLSWVDVLRKLRSNLLDKGFDQIPIFSSSHMINVTHPFEIIHRKESTYCGTRRAILVGINYTGQQRQQGKLSGCHNDVQCMKEYLIHQKGFKCNNITVLMDDGCHRRPTYENILDSYRDIVSITKAGDSVFCHYSGHGGTIRDRTEDENDGYLVETLIPVDFRTAGQITNDELFRDLVQPMPKHSLLFCLFDCCHSRTVLDLPYRFTATDKVSKGMQRVSDFDFEALFVTALACCCLMDVFRCIECLFV